ncbi:MAG: NUDIX domain-containing protein [Kineosporiaceae bacterium]
MRAEQRVAAYGVCRTARDGGGVVLARASARSDLRGRWFLPGGGLEHGEDPAAAVARWFAAATGLRVAVTGLRDVLDDIVDLPHRAASVHTVRIVFDVRELGDGPATLGDTGGDGLTDRVAVVGVDDADDLPLMPFAARVLGLSRPDPVVPVPPDLAPGGAGGSPAAAPAPTRVRRQRVGVYGLVESGGHVLLTRLSARTPAPGRWTLPGGGIHHGEAVRRALEREVHEESGLRLRSADLRAAVSHRFLGTSPAGIAEDYHGVQVLFTARVAPDTRGVLPPPRVVEPEGTTDAVAWAPLADAHSWGLTGMAAHGLTLLAGDPRARGGAPDPGPDPTVDLAADPAVLPVA